MDNVFERLGMHLSYCTCDPSEAIVRLGKWCSCLGLAELLSEAGVPGPGLEVQSRLAREGDWMITFPGKWVFGWAVED